jgi:hypothetical protein
MSLRNEHCRTGEGSVTCLATNAETGGGRLRLILAMALGSMARGFNLHLVLFFLVPVTINQKKFNSYVGHVRTERAMQMGAAMGGNKVNKGELKFYTAMQ